MSLLLKPNTGSSSSLLEQMESTMFTLDSLLGSGCQAQDKEKGQKIKGLLQKYQFFESHFQQNAHVLLNITRVSYFY